MHKNETTKVALSAKQDMFCREYMVDLNATQAAIRAGYAEGSATVQGARLIANVNVMARIAELAKEKVEKVDVTAAFVIGGIKDIAADPDATRFEKLKAFELLGKYLKLFVDRQEVEHKATITLIQLQDIRQQ